MKSIDKAKGFTLVEIMIVVAILAILATVATPIYRNYVRAGDVSECGNEIAAIRLAQEQFRFENNTYFAGGDIATLEVNSLGYYQSSWTTPAAIAAANCAISVGPGTTGTIATSYSVVSVGQNDLNASDTATLGN